MTTETQIPEPSDVIQDYLDAGDIRWATGSMRKRVEKADGTIVECHCGAQILRDRLAEIRNEDRSDGTFELEVERTLERFYQLQQEQVSRAIEINDTLDETDGKTRADLLRQSRVDGHAPLFEFFQEIAPKYLGRVRDYYVSIGR